LNPDSETGTTDSTEQLYGDEWYVFYFLAFGACMALAALFFFCLAASAFSCFCAACFCAAFGDLSPIDPRIRSIPNGVNPEKQCIHSSSPGNEWGFTTETQRGVAATKCSSLCSCSNAHRDQWDRIWCVPFVRPASSGRRSFRVNPTIQD
jgi:hypothetical protein